jgi:hypothetical protein
VPSNAARPHRRRLLRVAGVGLAGLALGAGATLAVHGLGGRPRPAASVQRLDLPGATPGAAGVGPAGAAAAGGKAAAPAAGAAGTARAAVRRFLQAGAAGDLEVAYGLLDEAGRRRYPSLARFTRAQADRAPVTAVRVGAERRAGPGRAEVTVTLGHPAAIDPFAGLVPARTVEVWRASRQAGRWRVAADPVSVRADLPGDDRAPEAVTAWVERLLDCDRAGAAGLQAAAELYGPADLAERPCAERGRWTVAAPEGFDAAVEPEAYVAAFGPEVGAWARLVPVQGPRTRFSVVVGPLGDAWRVLGTDPVPPR